MDTTKASFIIQTHTAPSVVTQTGNPPSRRPRLLPSFHPSNKINILAQQSSDSVPYARDPPSPLPPFPAKINPEKKSEPLSQELILYTT